MNLKALDACSLKSVDKVQLYEVYNHTTQNVSLLQDKNCCAYNNVPIDLEWI